MPIPKDRQANGRSGVCGLSAKQSGAITSRSHRRCRSSGICIAPISSGESCCCILFTDGRAERLPPVMGSRKSEWCNSSDNGLRAQSRAGTLTAFPRNRSAFKLLALLPQRQSCSKDNRRIFPAQFGQVEPGSARRSCEIASAATISRRFRSSSSAHSHPSYSSLVPASGKTTLSRSRIRTFANGPFTARHSTGRHFHRIYTNRWFATRVSSGQI